MKALFIGAHTDEELCFAGAMLKLSEQGYGIDYIALSSCGVDGIMDEYFNSCEILKANGHVCNFYVREFAQQSNAIADYLYDWNYEYEYNLVFTHSEKCKHPDHRTVGEESKRIFKGNLVTYLQPWNANEDPNYFIELSEQHLEKKIQALSCYKSQSHRNYMNPEFIRSQAIYNGIKCGKKYAEAFRIEKLIA